MALIIADTRERNGANPFLEVAIDENNRKYKLKNEGDISLQIKQITIGDYSILLADQTLALVIERKTWADLSASIKDGRINQQVKNLERIKLEKNCQIMFIIEGNLTYKDDYQIQHVPFKNLHAKMRHIMLRGIGFMQSKDEVHTAKIIVNLARDILKLRAKKEITFETSYHTELFALNEKYKIIEQNKEQNKEQNISGSNEEKDLIVPSDNIYQIPEQLKTRVKLSDLDLQLELWCGIPGITAKSAVILMNNFCINEIITAPKGSRTLIKNKIAELQYESGMKFGLKKAEKVMMLNYNGNDENKKAELNDLCVKVMTKVPGVSKKIAERILEEHSLRDICNNFVQADILCELRKNGRKIASLAAMEKLCGLFKIETTIDVNIISNI
jgi:ERCC4-type nuclease